MYKRVIIGALLALALLGAGIGIGAAIDGDWGPTRDAVVVHDGGTGDAGQTVVVTNGHGPHFFFPFVPLFFVLVVVLIVVLLRRGGRGRGGWGRGPGGGSPPPWVEEWHRRQHEGDAPAGPGGTTTA